MKWGKRRKHSDRGESIPPSGGSNIRRPVSGYQASEDGEKIDLSNPPSGGISAVQQVILRAKCVNCGMIRLESVERCPACDAVEYEIVRIYV